MLTPSDDADLHRQAAESFDDETMAMDFEPIEQRLLAMSRYWSNSTASERLAAYARDLSPEPVSLDSMAAIPHNLALREAQSDLVANAPKEESYPKQKGSHTMKTMATSRLVHPEGGPPPRRSAPSRLTAVAAVLITGVLVAGAAVGFLSLHTRQKAPPATQTRHLAVHAGTLHCSSAPFSFGNALDTELVAQPPLNWSVRGDLATTFPTRIFRGDTCAQESLAQGDIADLAQGVWSPDGTRALLPTGDSAQVVDSTTGHRLVTLQMNDTHFSLSGVAWTADGTQIVAALYNPTTMTHTTESVKIEVWDSRTGDLVRTAFSFDRVLIGGARISPNGAYVAVEPSGQSIEIWDTATGQQVSTLSSSAALQPNSVAWSPDGTLLALGIGSANWPATPAKVQVWSTVSGKLVATLTDTYTFEGEIDGLAWSPNGQYLAESSGQISIWDTTTWQEVATFGKVATHTQLAGSGDVTHFSLIETVTWSPDGSMLASVTHSFEAGPSTPTSNVSNVLDVWQLS